MVKTERTLHTVNEQSSWMTWPQCPFALTSALSQVCAGSVTPEVWATTDTGVCFMSRALADVRVSLFVLITDCLPYQHTLKGTSENDK